MAADAVRWTLYLSLFAVPLLIASPDAMFGYADVPKIAAARALAGLIGVFWLAEWAASVMRRGLAVQAIRLPRAAALIAVSAAAFLLVNLISSALSISPDTSFAGAYPGYDGADVYSLAAYALLGAAAAAHLRTRRQIARLSWALGFAGAIASVYGILQFAGTDPFHFDRFEVNDGRSPLTFGNPSFAGSFLVISLFATVGLFMLRQRRLAWQTGLLWAMVTVQAAALGATASRGAWAGAVAGGLALVLLACVINRRRLMPRLALLAAPAAVALAALLLYSASGASERAVERLQSLNGDFASAGINGRQSTWTATARMIASRPAVEGDTSSPIFRHLFGYGPDTYRYAYQQVSPDEHAGRFVPHAHNSFLNAAAELGVAGLLAWTALNAAVLWTGARLAWRKGSVFWVRVTAAALTAAFMAHFVDQLVNVPRASDSAAFWVLAGAIVTLSVVGRRANPAQESAQPAFSSSRLRPALVPAAPAIAIPLAAGILALTWLGNAGHVRADFEAARLQSVMTQGAQVSDISTLAGQASGLAPDVAHYHTLEAMALESAAGVLLPGFVTWAQFEDRALAARRSAVKASPLGPGERLGLARSLYRRAVAVEPEMIAGAVAEYEKAVALAPRFWNPWLELAAAYGAAGRTADGVEALQEASELLRKQAEVTREDPETLQQFAAVHQLLDLEPGAYYP